MQIYTVCNQKDTTRMHLTRFVLLIRFFEVSLIHHECYLTCISDKYTINTDYVNKKSKFKLPTSTVKDHAEKEVMWEMGNVKWEVESGKWEVGSGR